MKIIDDRSILIKENVKGKLLNFDNNFILQF